MGVYEFLKQKLPEPARELWNDFGRISKQVLIEIEDQLGYMLANIDSFSPEMAATRIHGLAMGWEKDAEHLSLIVDKVAGLQIQFDDPKSNTILREYLPGSIRRFSRIVSSVMQIRPEDLLLK